MAEYRSRKRVKAFQLTGEGTIKSCWYRDDLNNGYNLHKFKDGDYLVIDNEMPDDIYIEDKEIFESEYDQKGL